MKVLEYAVDRPTGRNPRQKQIPNQTSLPGKLTNLPTQTKITTTVGSVAGPLAKERDASPWIQTRVPVGGGFNRLQYFFTL